jgi:hypothetical protein
MRTFVGVLVALVLVFIGCVLAALGHEVPSQTGRDVYYLAVILVTSCSFGILIVCGLAAGS